MRVPLTNMQAIGYLTTFELWPEGPPHAAGFEAPPVERRSPVKSADEANEPPLPYGRRLNDIGQEHRRFLAFH